MQCVVFTSLMMLQIIHGQSINTKSHDVIFETRSIWLKLNSGRTIPLSFRGQLERYRSPLVQFQQNTPRLNLKNLSAAPRGFWDCLGVFCSKPSRQSQKHLGCASRFLRLSRGFWVHILLVSKITSCDFIYYTTPIVFIFVNRGI